MRRGALERYAHISPARGLFIRRCGSSCPGTGDRCTREKDHRGPHVSHGFWGRIRAVWDLAERPRASPEAGHRASEARFQGGLPSRRSYSLRDSLGSRVMRILSSPEELALLVLFVAFVYFGIDWLLRILGR